MATVAPDLELSGQSVDTLVRTPETSGEQKTARRTALWVTIISLLVSVPCFWKPRVHSLDLPSHVYNAWLADLAASNAAPGIHVATVWTNVLFDWFLSALISLTTISMAERLSVWVCALTFFWSCFAFLSRCVGHPAWAAVPLIGAVTYGAMFRLGFFNLYLGTALALVFMAIAWRPSRTRILLCMPLLVLAALAHSIPAAWGIASIAFLAIMRRVSGKIRLAVTAGAAVLLWIVELVVSRTLVTYRESERLSAFGALDLTGAAQLVIYDNRFLLLAYAWIVAAVLAVALKWPLRREVMTAPLLHLWLLHVLAFAIVPDAVQFSAYSVPLGFLPMRIGWFASIIALIGLYHVLGRGTVVVFALLTVAFVSLTYTVDSASEAVVNHMEGSVKSLPAESSVVAAFRPMSTRFQTFTHALERACIGHCFSFGNYEPASRAFRVRAHEGSPVATSNSADVSSMEIGEFVRRETHPPLYTICNCPEEPARLCPRSMQIGDRVCSIDAEPLIPQ